MKTIRQKTLGLLSVLFLFVAVTSPAAPYPYRLTLTDASGNSVVATFDGTPGNESSDPGLQTTDPVTDIANLQLTINGVLYAGPLYSGGYSSAAFGGLNTTGLTGTGPFFSVSGDGPNFWFSSDPLGPGAGATFFAGDGAGTDPAQGLYYFGSVVDGNAFTVGPERPATYSLQQVPDSTNTLLLLGFSVLMLVGGYRKFAPRR